MGIEFWLFHLPLSVLLWGFVGLILWAIGWALYNELSGKGGW